MSFLNHLVENSNTYQGKKVTLNKPFRTPDGPKKFSVYVKNDKGNVVKVNFGDPDMDIKRDSDERRKSFRARHNCDDPGPKWKARYWSCKMWQSNKTVSDVKEALEILDESDAETDIIESVGIYSRLVDGSLRVNEEKVDESFNPYDLLQENVKIAEIGLDESSPSSIRSEIDALVDYILKQGKE